MDKEEYIKKVTAYRVIADDLLTDAYKLNDKDVRWEAIFYAEHILDDVDALLNFLNSVEELP